MQAFTIHKEVARPRGALRVSAQSRNCGLRSLRISFFSWHSQSDPGDLVFVASLSGEQHSEAQQVP